MNVPEGIVKNLSNSLILGKNSCVISYDDIIHLSLWLSLIFVLWERSATSQPVITDDELQYLRFERHPPNDWHIYIAANRDTNWAKRSDYHPSALGEEDAISGRMNTVLVSLGIGSLFCHIVRSTDPSVIGDVGEYASNFGLQQIWPVPAKLALADGGGLAWPPRQPVPVPLDLIATFEQRKLLARTLPPQGSS